MIYDDNYIEPPETCRWLLGLTPGCCIDDPLEMCAECPNLTPEELQRRETEAREWCQKLGIKLRSC